MKGVAAPQDASYHQCDNVEEETCGTGRPEHVPLKSPMSAMVGSECAAAVNLLSMTVREGALPANTLDEHIAKQVLNAVFQFLLLLRGQVVGHLEQLSM